MLASRGIMYVVSPSRSICSMSTSQATQMSPAWRIDRVMDPIESGRGMNVFPASLSGLRRTLIIWSMAAQRISLS